jgi:hypothetical protein
MPVPFTQQQLDAFWTRYVSMSACDVIYVSAVEPEFGAMLWFCQSNNLYGFLDYADPGSSNIKYIGGCGIWWNGPTKS